MDGDCQPIIIDVGSHTTKAGFAGDDAPRCVFPTIVNEESIGDEALSNGGNLITPVSKTGVTDWTALEKIYWHIFYKGLNIAPESHPLLLAHSPLASTQDRDEMVKLMFENFNVPALDLVPDAVLAVYAAQRTTGLVVDFGNEAPSVCAVVEGMVVGSSIGPVDVEHVPGAVMEVVANCPGGVQEVLLGNIILSGGTRIPNVAEFIQTETVNLVGQEVTDNLDITDPANREISVWIGGGVVGSNPAFQNLWVSKERYDEDGAGGFHRKYGV